MVRALPGCMGFETLRTAIECGKNTVDISFCPENPLELDALARERGVSVLVDMGVAPGMDHVLLGHHDASMRVESFEIEGETDAGTAGYRRFKGAPIGAGRTLTLRVHSGEGEAALTVGDHQDLLGQPAVGHPGFR